MNIPSLHEEKKIDDHDADGSSRVERLERLVEILCNDLFHVKEQQLRSKKQVLDLQADLAAAELAREEAERQMERLQLRDHKLLLSLVEKLQQNEAEKLPQINLPHVRTHSMNRHIEHKNIDLIDVTSYEENIGEAEQVYHLDDIHPEDASCEQYMLQLWEDLSSSVQQLSSDLIEQRDAFEFVWTKFQLTSNQRMAALEDANATQLDALKVMAAEWDTKLFELNDHVQLVDDKYSTEKASMTSINSEMNTKIHYLGKQLKQLQSSVQRHMDYNRCINGERLVVKREYEVQFQKLHAMIQNLTTIIHEHANQTCDVQPEPATCQNNDNLTVANETLLDHKSADMTENDVMPLDSDNDTILTSVTWPIIGDGATSSPEDFHNRNNKQRIANTMILQRCQSH